MLGKIKKTVKHTIVYSLGNLSSKLVGFILLPIYTSHLTTSEYGILAILEATSQILIEVLSFNISVAMLRWCTQEKDHVKEKTIIFTTFSSIFFLAVLIVVVLFPFSKDLSTLFFGSGNYIEYFQWLLIWIGTGIINKFPLALARLRERSSFFVALNIIKFILIVVFNIYFLAFLNLGVLGIIYAQVIGQAVLFVLSIPITIQNITIKFNFPVLKEMFFYGFPLIFSTVSSMILSLGDRYILPYFLDFSSLGIYALGYKIASVINVFLLNSFQLGFLPIAFQMLDKPGANRFFSKTFTYFVFAFVIAFLGISLFSKEIIFLLSRNDEFNSAYTVVPFLAFAFVLRGIHYYFSLGFHFSKKTKYNAFIVSGGATLHIILNFIFVPIFSMYGAAIAFVISTTAMSLAAKNIASNVYPISYEINKILKMIIIALLLVSIPFGLPDLHFTLMLAIKTVLLLSFPVVLYFFHFYEEVELLRLKQSWEKWRNPFNWISNLRKIKF